MLRNNAQDVSVISDESVTECVYEQTCTSLQGHHGNCNDDENVGLGAAVMAEAAAPLQAELIDCDNSDVTGTPQRRIAVDSALQTGETVRLTEKPDSLCRNYDANSSDVSHSATAIVDMGVDVRAHTATAAEQVKAESDCLPAVSYTHLTLPTKRIV